MKNFISYLLFALLAPLFASSQSNYKPGYVVTLKGDTIKGFIDYREWDMNPGTVNFKKSTSDADGKTYGVSDIAGFGIDHLERYVLYNGPVTTDSTDPDKVANMGEDDRDTSFRVAAVFLKELEKGEKLALYSYKDELKQRFFTAEAPAYVPEELIFRLNKRGPEILFGNS